MKQLLLILLTLILFTLSPVTALAQGGTTGKGTLTKPSTNGIINPVIGNLGSSPDAANSGSIVLGYFIIIWKTIINLGAMLVIVYFLWGSIDWITSGGDSGKVASARNKMVQAFIGLLLLSFSFVIIAFIGNLFFGDQFNILDLTFITI